MDQGPKLEAQGSVWELFETRLSRELKQPTACGVHALLRDKLVEDKGERRKEDLSHLGLSWRGKCIVVGKLEN
jgi:hypothetical protein